VAGLDLRGTGIVDEKAVESIPTGDEMVENIHQRMRDMGIPEITSPKGDPPPTLAEIDTTSMSMRELERMYAQYVSYAEFINPIVEARSAALRAEKSRLQLVKARVTKILREDGVAKSDIVSMRDAHEQVEEVAASILFIESERDIIRATAKVYVNEAKALSRIVEMRKIDFEQSNRSGNLSRGTKSSSRLAKRRFRERSDE
jgi:hypothetical protein